MGKIASIMLSMMLAGCVTGGSFCEVAKPHRFSAAAIAAMNDREVDAALAHNEKGQKLCGWRP